MEKNSDLRTLQTVRTMLHTGDFVSAETLLDRVSEHGAEWHFLKGAVCFRRGWMDEALQHYEAAAALEPGNPEYRKAAERMRNGPHRQNGDKPFGTLMAEGFCLGIGGLYVLCNVCGCCGGCAGCMGCLYCIQGIPH